MSTLIHRTLLLVASLTLAAVVAIGGVQFAKQYKFRSQYKPGAMHLMLVNAKDRSRVLRLQKAEGLKDLRCPDQSKPCIGFVSSAQDAWGKSTDGSNSADCRICGETPRLKDGSKNSRVEKDGSKSSRVEVALAAFPGERWLPAIVPARRALSIQGKQLEQIAPLKGPAVSEQADGWETSVVTSVANGSSRGRGAEGQPCDPYQDELSYTDLSLVPGTTLGPDFAGPTAFFTAISEVERQPDGRVCFIAVCVK